jgi:hypothetical protein
MLIGLVLGSYLNYRYCQFVLSELCNRDVNKKYDGVYSKKLKRIYGLLPQKERALPHDK